MHRVKTASSGDSKLQPQTKDSPFFKTQARFLRFFLYLFGHFSKHFLLWRNNLIGHLTRQDPPCRTCLLVHSLQWEGDIVHAEQLGSVHPANKQSVLHRCIDWRSTHDDANKTQNFMDPTLIFSFLQTLLNWQFNLMQKLNQKILYFYFF